MFLITNYSQSQTVNKWATQGNIADSTSFLGTKNASCLRFRSNNIERMRITNDGKVGIGILNPTKRFEVNGSSLINGNLFLPTLDTVTNFETNKLLFVDESGKLVKGGIDQLRMAIFGTGTEQGPIGIEPCSFDIIQQNPVWYSAPYKLYSLCPDVKVGIGTDNPLHTLDVHGTARITETTYTNRLKVGKETSETGMIAGYYTGTTASTYNLLNLGVYNPQDQTTIPILTIDPKGNLILRNKDEMIFFVDADASTPTLRARRIVVDQHTWSDNVFQKDYALPSLIQVKEYIDKNGHLPGVPSENEVLENGVDLADMNTILLKKIEELTRYVIQQQEEIEKLKNSR